MDDQSKNELSSFGITMALLLVITVASRFAGPGVMPLPLIIGLAGVFAFIKFPAMFEGMLERTSISRDDFEKWKDEDDRQGAGAVLAKLEKTELEAVAAVPEEAKPRTRRRL